MSRAEISVPPWEVERHHRGSIRWYPFDALMQAGAASAGSTRTLASPIVSHTTGPATATPQSRAVESVERRTGAGLSVIWSGADGLDYWSRPHHAQVFMGIASGSLVTPANGRIYGMLFLESIPPSGLPPIPANPIRPLVTLRYARNGPTDPNGPDERYELITAVGNSTAFVLTRLTNITAPVAPITQRLEIVYKPGQYAKAYIDGKLGAVNTTGLPNTAFIPPTTQNMAGVGAYLENGQIGDLCIADFHSLMIETPRA